MNKITEFSIVEITENVVICVNGLKFPLTHYVEKYILKGILYGPMTKIVGKYSTFYNPEVNSDLTSFYERNY